MPIHLNPFKLYKGRVCLNHGLLVDMLRSSQVFWVAYKDLLEINGKKESDVKELRIMMKNMGLVPKERKRFTEKKNARVLARVYKDFDSAEKDIDKMFKGLERIMRDDETFLFRAVKELRLLYLRFMGIKHIPDHMRYNIMNHLYSLMQHMYDIQRSTWIVSKAHARGFSKIKEISLVTSHRERRRIRMQTLELDHLRNRIEPLKAWLMRLKEAKTHHDIHKLHEKITDFLRLYHEEMSDLKHILHEVHILTRRTEKLFKAIQHEAESLDLKYLKKKVRSYAKKFRRLHNKIETQARRECIDINHLVKKLPAPPKPAAKPAAEPMAEAA